MTLGAGFADAGVVAHMTFATKKDFTTHVERLIAELRSRGRADGDLRRRRDEALMDGYSRALALEGQRRRVRKRQLQVADLPQPDAGASQELTALARQEALLNRAERELRAQLAALRAATRE